jgi:hypothetical protein
VPTCGETGQWRDVGIACQPRGLGRRSGHSTQPPKVMLGTWGRAAGLWRCPRPCGGGREPRGDQRSRQTTLQAWRAVCAETCKHGFGGGRLETCRKVTRWPPTLLIGRKVRLSQERIEYRIADWKRNTSPFSGSEDRKRPHFWPLLPNQYRLQ